LAPGKPLTQVSHPGATECGRAKAEEPGPHTHPRLPCLRPLAMLFMNPLDPKSRVLIEDDVLVALHTFRQVRSDQSESGGVLLGYRRSPHLHIVEFTTPGAQDRQSRYVFERCDPFHMKHARKRWKATRGKMGFLGEWHTHPETDPHPSSLDYSEWERVLSGVDFARTFVIIGLHQDWVGVGQQRRITPALPAQ
jgi:integrative and conjugative element protein (TIGR02256 family)